MREAGYTRVSLGMQSAAPQVLAVLDPHALPGARAGGGSGGQGRGVRTRQHRPHLRHAGESDDDLRRSIDVAVGADVDHVSAYSLIVEDGTALARRVRRGEIARPDDDVLAQRYELLDSRLSAAGLHWYEVSNWSA